MQAIKETEASFLSVKSAKRTQKINTSPALKALRLTHVLLITIFPLLGTMYAIADLWKHPIDPLDIELLIGMFVLTAVGIEVGYHRYFSHRSFKANRVVSATLAILGSMAAQGPVMYWVCLHRRHHEYSDSLNDPHSPNLHGKSIVAKIQGLWHSHIGWMFNHEIPNPVYYSPEILRNSDISGISRLYFVWLLLGLAIPTILGGILRESWSGAWHGFLWGGVVRLLVGENVIWTINSIVHVFGSRPFKTQDGSRNVFWLAIPTLGGSWHNNHHAFPSSAINGLSWWQLDIGGYLIKALEFTGLVWDVKKPTSQMIEAKRMVTQEKHCEGGIA